MRPPGPSDRRGAGVRGRRPSSYAPIAELLRSPRDPTVARPLDDVWLSEIARVVPELLTERPGLPMPGRSRGERAQPPVRGAGPALPAPGARWCWSSTTCSGAMRETLEFLHFAVRFASGVPLLVIGTAREEALHDIGPVARVDRRAAGIDALVELPFARLDAADAAALANELLGESRTTRWCDSSWTTQKAVRCSSSSWPAAVWSRRAATGPSPAPPAEGAGRHRGPPRPAVRTPARQLVGTAAVVGRAFDSERGDPPPPCPRRRRRRGARRAVAARHRPRAGAGRLRLQSRQDPRGGLRGDRPGSPSSPSPRRGAGARVPPRRRARTRSPHRSPPTTTAPARSSRRSTTTRAAIDAAQHLFAHEDVMRMARHGLQLVGVASRGVERDDASSLLLLPLGVALYAGSGVLDEELFARATLLSAERGLPTEPSTFRLSANAAIARRDFVESDRCGRLLLARATRPTIRSLRHRGPLPARREQLLARSASPCHTAICSPRWPPIGQSGQESTSNGSPRTPGRSAWCA